MRWKCTVCDYTHIGEEPPSRCPVCGASGDDFISLEDTPPMTTLQQHLAILQCPLCHQGFRLGGNSLYCPKGHSYDISRTGYFNATQKPAQNDYGKDLLLARRQLQQAGFFTPLLQAILPLLPQKGYLLDAGCGEGSHLDYLTTQSGLIGAGIDLSKEGVLLASKAFKKKLWAVADLAAAPFRAGGFSSIVNILSPANYSEFKRLLAPKGRLIKVVPNAEYLQQLRQLFYVGTTKEQYSNKETTALFFEAFPTASLHTVEYSFPMTDELIPPLLAMTPLTKNITQREKQGITLDALPQITLAFTILSATV